MARFALIFIAASTLATVVACADPEAGSVCATARDCSDGRVCLAGFCSPSPRCAVDVECDAGRICVEGRCALRSCRDGDDCPGRRCADGWCAPWPVIECAGDEECPAGPCDDASGLCVIAVCGDDGCSTAPCATDGVCSAGRYCADDGVCRLGCRVDGCGDDAVCDETSRTCTRVGCRVDPDCPAGAYCSRGECRPGCRLDPDDCPTGRCDRATRRCGCGGDVDCAADAYCAEDGVCRVGCRMGGCAETFCDPMTRRCGDLACARDADCDPTRVCWPEAAGPACRPPAGPGRVESPCAQDRDCATGVCLPEGVCRGLCSADSDCPSGRCALFEGIFVCRPVPMACDRAATCAVGRTCRPWRGDGPPTLACLPPVGPGGPELPCAIDADCASGVCAGDRCWSPCADDADCAGVCLPAVHVVIDDNGSPELEDDRRVAFAGCVNGSGRPCLREGDCPAEACVVRATGDGRGFDPRCLPPTGAGRGGDVCVDGSGCRSAWCEDGRCIEPCVDGSDCVDGAPCAETEVRTWDRGTADPDDDLRASLRACGGG